MGDNFDFLSNEIKYFKNRKLYNFYNFIHSKDLLNTTRKYNLWKLKLTT